MATGGPKVGGQAGAMLAPVLGALRRTDAARTLIALGQAARALAPGLDAGQAETALAVVLDAVPRTNGPKARAALAQAAQALVPALPRPLPTDRRQGLLRLAQARLADAALAEAAVAWAGVLEAMLRPLTDGDYVAAVVELLKYPSAALRVPPEDGGPASATAYLLDRLRKRFPAADGLRAAACPTPWRGSPGPFPASTSGTGRRATSAPP